MRETYAESLRRQRMAAAKAATSAALFGRDKPTQLTDALSAAKQQPEELQTKERCAGLSSTLRSGELSNDALDIHKKMEGLCMKSPTHLDALSSHARIAGLHPEGRSAGVTDDGNEEVHEDAAASPSSHGSNHGERSLGSEDDGVVEELQTVENEFLAAFRHRLNHAAIAERIQDSKERERQGYEALLTYEMIIENPIAENDPALDRMLASRAQLAVGSGGGGRVLGIENSQKKDVKHGDGTRFVTGSKSAGFKHGKRILSRGLSATRGEVLPRLPECSG